MSNLAVRGLSGSIQLGEAGKTVSEKEGNLQERAVTRISIQHPEEFDPVIAGLEAESSKNNMLRVACCIAAVAVCAISLTVAAYTLLPVDVGIYIAFSLLLSMLVSMLGVLIDSHFCQKNREIWNKKMELGQCQQAMKQVPFQQFARQLGASTLTPDQWIKLRHVYRREQNHQEWQQMSQKYFRKEQARIEKEKTDLRRELAGS